MMETGKWTDKNISDWYQGVKKGRLCLNRYSLGYYISTET